MKTILLILASFFVISTASAQEEPTPEDQPTLLLTYLLTDPELPPLDIYNPGSQCHRGQMVEAYIGYSLIFTPFIACAIMTGYYGNCWVKFYDSWFL